ncbi:spermidine synthase-like [Paramacrobiotus metropolitanus]|uniref:spermidine synthase-like n=1 Tax=Paramacrobiotus metropolitanus TaxID=2943436 RepID=UPI002446295D|nr:spermidine synthase-like [Paramacrobiotus metropolitanus]
MFFVDRNIPRRSSESATADRRDSFHTSSNGRKWFTEVDHELLPGQVQGFEINRVIAHRVTLHKEIFLLNSTAHGKVLVFDGLTQGTENDGFAYYEMCSHVPLCCHPEPKRVLVMGGLDCSGLGIEILKHPSVERIVHCEEDSEMIDFLKVHFTQKGFNHNSNKYEYYPMEAKEYLRGHNEEFDVIITDFELPSPDTEGFFGDSFFELVKTALKPDGVTITQSWGIWVELRPPTMMLKENMRWARNLFDSVDYYTLAAPSFTCGQAGNIICSKELNRQFKAPVRALAETTIKEWKLRYYNPDIHTASFALPQFAKDLLFSTETSRRFTM